MKALLLTIGFIAAAFLTAFVLNFVGVVAFRSSDGAALAAQIANKLTATTGQAAKVQCPTKIPEKKGGIEDCTAVIGRSTTIVRVVQDDSYGHLHWTVADPTALTSADPSPAPVATTSLPTMARTQAQYDGVEATFLTDCVNQFGGSATCECLLTALEKQGGPAQVQRVDDGIRYGGSSMPAETQPLLGQCSQLK